VYSTSHEHELELISLISTGERSASKFSAAALALACDLAAWRSLRGFSMHAPDFDRMAVMVAGGVTRRRAMRYLGGSLASALAGALLRRPGIASAVLECTTDQECAKLGGTACVPLTCQVIPGDGRKACIDAPRPDGAQCGPNDDPCHAPVCQHGNCVSGGTLADGTDCDDGDACTSDTSCQQGVCTGGEAIACPSTGNPCRPQQCDSQTGECVLLQSQDGTPCDDGNPGTTGSTCQAGVCAGGQPTTGGQTPTNSPPPTGGHHRRKHHHHRKSRR
jgi:hypothetical protein